MLDALLLNLPIILCALIGIGLLVLELFIPGFGVAGLSGIILLVVSVWLTFTTHGTIPALLLFLMLAIITALMFSSLLKSVREGKLAKSPMVLNEQSVAEVSEKSDVTSLIGKSGIASTVLRPAGMAEIDGRRVNVQTEGEFAAEGSRVVVVKADAHRVVVSKSP